MLPPNFCALRASRARRPASSSITIPDIHPHSLCPLRSDLWASSPSRSVRPVCRSHLPHVFNYLQGPLYMTSMFRACSSLMRGSLRPGPVCRAHLAEKRGQQTLQVVPSLLCLSRARVQSKPESMTSSRQEREACHVHVEIRPKSRCSYRDPSSQISLSPTSHRPTYLSPSSLQLISHACPTGPHYVWCPVQLPTVVEPFQPGNLCPLLLCCLTALLAVWGGLPIICLSLLSLSGQTPHLWAQFRPQPCAAASRRLPSAFALSKVSGPGAGGPQEHAFCAPLPPPRRMCCMCVTALLVRRPHHAPRPQ